ncbi:MAG: hypothetical protein QOG60_2306, partial [Frankiaceae bacterium]|nr:hypothetical protein [Frankiaceae bacterium]
MSGVPRRIVVPFRLAFVGVLFMLGTLIAVV